MAGGFYLGTKQSAVTPFFTENKEDQKTFNAQLKLMRVMDLIKEQYVDSVNETNLVEQTIGQMLTSLDPHSVYLPFEENIREEEQLRGNFFGVGVKFMILKDTLTITNVIKDGPSYIGGLKNGDRIIKINEKEVAGVSISNTEVMKLLKGQRNTKVNITVKRDSKLLTKEVTRGLIPIYSVSASFMLKSKIGYIKLERFSETSHDEFVEAAQLLLDKGMNHLVFDLRGNGGGYLDIAHKIVDEFLERDKMIVFTKDKIGDRDKYFSTRRGILKNTKVSVLIDSESASASEIVAGAIQDNDRGTIYGRRSFGKGLVQSPIMLKDSSLVRITVARYYTPTGRCIQKPYNGVYHEYLMDLYNRDQNGELFELDSSLYVDSLKYITPGGKVVYGGGGISPDVFIPYDTVGFSDYYRNLSFSTMFSEFSIRYLDRYRNKWASKSLNYFAQNFIVTEGLFQNFIKYATNQGIELNEIAALHSKQRIKQRLKAEIASNIWDDEGRIYISSRFDTDIQTLLKK